MADADAAGAAGTVVTPNTSPEFVWPMAMRARLKISYMADRLETHCEEVKFDKLTEFASNLRSGIGCRLASQLNSGASWFVRLLVFDDGVRWVARVSHGKLFPGGVEFWKSEIDTTELLRERGLPVPEIYGYELADTTIGRPFMLMEYLPYNSKIDVEEACEQHPNLYPLTNDKHCSLPDNFYRSLAEFQVRLASVRLRAIGLVSKGEGGDFVFSPAARTTAVHTATRSYLEDWIGRPMSVPAEFATYYRLSRSEADESLKGLRDFPTTLREIAATFDGDDDNSDEQEVGFPLVHPNLGPQDVLVDDDLNVTGVVDWTGASTTPWPLVKFPECGSFALPDVPGYKNPMYGGADVYAADLKRREKYIGFVKEAEEKLGTDRKLSSTLEKIKWQYLNRAMYSYAGRSGPNSERLRTLFLKT